jgi:hypothetical protein
MSEVSVVIPMIRAHLEELSRAPELQATPLIERTRWDVLLKLPGWALIEDGKTIAAGGIVNLWKGVGEVWVAATNVAQAHPMALARGVIKTLEYVESQGTYHRLQMTTETTPGYLRWAVFLGFKLEATLHKYLPNGQDRYLFAKVYGT